MAIFFSSSDDCRLPKIQFKNMEKMFFVSREFSRFVNFAFLWHFVIVLIIFVVFLLFFIYFSYYFLFLTLFWSSIFSSKINPWFSAKNWIVKKTSKNKNIDVNNETIIEKSTNMMKITTKYNFLYNAQKLQLTKNIFLIFDNELI